MWVADHHSTGLPGHVLGVIIGAVVDHQNQIHPGNCTGAAHSCGNAPGLVFCRNYDGDPDCRI